MKKNTLIFLFSLCGLLSLAENRPGSSNSLDPTNPITFRGDHIIYQGKTIPLDTKNFFIDGTLTDAEASRYPYVFNSVNEALKHITDGSEAAPMTLYIAPYVYWIDNPDDETIRKPEKGSIPYGRIVKCNWLTFHGLTNEPRNVILASRRGQTQGAIGNFTMFYFDGDGITSENITFGNYCNVDLEYPLLPALNRKKRSSTVTQAQLIICNSDKVVARNTHFISRLNLCPFAGAKRIIFDACYFESTDDALCGTGVYLNCRFTFFSSKPFYCTQGTGAVFLNCDFDVLTQRRQYLTKVGSPVTIVDSRFKNSGEPLYIGWTQDPTDDLRCYQYNVSLNGKPIYINEEKPGVTVDMTGKPVLDAYRVTYGNRVIYNTYNLLRGNDDWDPMGVKDEVLKAEKETGRNLTQIPTYLKITPASASIESGVTTERLQTTVKRFGNIEHNELPINWSVSSKALVALGSYTGSEVEASGTNENEETKRVLVNAATTSGLESATLLTVSPKFLDAPPFTELPRIVCERKAELAVTYKIDLQGRKDESLITWYRCTDAKGSNPIAISVSRLKQPEYTYRLTPADVGYYIAVSVEPKHLRCHPGKAEITVMPTAIKKEEVTDAPFYYTDFRNFPTYAQPNIIPGFWTVDGYKPSGLEQYDWEAPTGETWYYGKGIDGMRGTGLVQASKGARILYTPIEATYKDMSVVLNVDPGKQAGQGFGSATGQYMDIYIKFDAQTLNGYGLRIIRTTKYDHAVDFILMKYTNGTATPISEPMPAICFRTDCTITLEVKGNTLTAHVETKTDLPEPKFPELKKKVNLQTKITPNPYGGMGVQHTGSVGASATMLHQLRITWEK